MKNNPFIELPVEELNQLFEATDSMSPDLIKIGEAIDLKVKGKAAKTTFEESFNLIVD